MYQIKWKPTEALNSSRQVLDAYSTSVEHHLRQDGMGAAPRKRRHPKLLNLKP